MAHLFLSRNIEDGNASGQAPPIDGKSLLPMLLGEGGPVRTYTLQEGYQSCEAGHGEGRACSRKGPRPPPGPPPPPPTPFACTAAAGERGFPVSLACVRVREEIMGLIRIRND
jgi:hypothetical protein